MSRAGDMISMMLVRYSWPQLLRAATTLVRLMQRQAGRDDTPHYLLDPEEALWARATWVQWLDDDPQAQCPVQEQAQTWIRACFLLLLLYDERVQCFVMAQHDVHTQLGSRAPPPHKANRYMDAVRPLVDSALQRCISLTTHWWIWPPQSGRAITCITRCTEEKKTYHTEAIHKDCREKRVEVAALAGARVDRDEDVRDRLLQSVGARDHRIDPLALERRRGHWACCPCSAARDCTRPCR